MTNRIYPHMLAWREDPSDPDRPILSNPGVQRLIAEVAPGSEATDLGGAFSLNVRMEPAGLVLRVHQPFVTRRRLLAQQEVRRRLATLGLTVPVPLAWRGSALLRCGGRWAELEGYIPHEMPPPELESYSWLYGAMGTLHRALDETGVRVPRPFFAPYGPPGTLLRWLPELESAVRDDPEAAEIARHLRRLIGRLRSQWTPARELPVRLVHGDVKLRNVARGADGGTVYLDFGFMAHRPRVHELGYSLARMLLTIGVDQDPGSFAWESVPRLVTEYEATSGARLTPVEWRALAPYTASVALYQAAACGFLPDPAATLRDSERRPLMRIGEWLLAHPDAVLS
ncbi:MAG: aminoglycoside phosphotransferase family protein [Chloroflexota bacterium]|nr:aminoglycoside phosphotransferase family protein [Chloroflexota bacterium]